MVATTELNKIAQEIWSNKKFSNTVSCNGRNAYSLSQNQIDFINTAIDKFSEIYTKMLDDYNQRNYTDGFFGILATMINNHFAVGRDVRIMGDNPSWTAGFARGLIALYRLYLDEKNKKGAAEKQRVNALMKPLFDFLGSDIKRAINFFTKFMVNIAIRFQFSIQLLDRSEHGLENFSLYICCMSIENCMRLNAEEVKLYSTANAKMVFLGLELIKNSRENKQVWRNNNLKVGDMKFDISNLLYCSPLESPAKDPMDRREHVFWLYNGEVGDQNAGLMPNQLCTDEEIAPIKGRYKKIGI